MENTTTYPTQPSPEGFFYENENEASQEILTRVYDNGSIVKQVKLPKCGKLAVIRSLKAKATTEIRRFMGGDADKYEVAVVTTAATLDGNKMTIEEIEELPLKDFQLLLSMCGELNF